MMKLMLPQDTRSIEMVSAISLLLIGIAINFITAYSNMIQIHSQHFWSVILMVFGALQVASIVYSENLHIVRTITSWTVGYFFVWIGFSSILVHPTTNDFAAIILGFGNWYAFVLNLNLMRKSWNN